MFRKSVSFILVMFMALSLLTGCGSGTENTTEADATKPSANEPVGTVAAETSAAQEKVTIKFWAYSRWNGINGNEPDGQPGDWEKSRADAFSEKYPNVTVEFQNLPYKGGPEKVNVAIASRTQPDVLQDYPGRFYGYVINNALLPLDDTVTAEELSDYYEGAWDSCMFTDGKHYMFPIGSVVTPLLINLDLFKAAGAENLLPTNAEKTWTYEQFKAALKAVTKDGVYGTALYAANEQNDNATTGIIWGYGADLINKSCDKVVLNSPEGVKGLEFLVSLVNEKIAMPGAETLSNIDTVNLFKQQKIAVFLPGTPAYYQQVYDESKEGKYKGFEVGWAQYPTAEGVAPRFYPNYVGTAVFKCDDAYQQKMAVELAKFVTNTDSVIAFKASQLIPTRKSAGNLYPGKELMEWCSLVTKYSYDPGYAAQGYAEVRAAFFPELQAAYIGSKTPKQALDDFAVKAQASLDKYKK